MAPWHRACALKGAVGAPDTTDLLLFHSLSGQSTHDPLVASLGYKRKLKGTCKQSGQLTSIVLGRCSNFTLLKSSVWENGIFGNTDFLQTHQPLLSDITFPQEL